MLKYNFMLQGIKFLQEKALLDKASSDVALFLFSTDQLDKGAIGVYLRER